MATATTDVWSFSEAAREFDTDIRTVSGLVKALGITTLPVPRNGKARGLDAHSMKRLAQSLGRRSWRATQA